MNSLLLSAAVQLTLVMGVASLLWPEKFMAVFEILLYPWTPTRRMLRANSVAAIAMAVVLFVTLMGRVH